MGVITVTWICTSFLIALLLLNGATNALAYKDCWVASDCHPYHSECTREGLSLKGKCGGPPTPEGEG